MHVVADPDFFSELEAAKILSYNRRDFTAWDGRRYSKYFEAQGNHRLVISEIRSIYYGFNALNIPRGE